jgi:hypothetical protein
MTAQAALDKLQRGPLVPFDKLNAVKDTLRLNADLLATPSGAEGLVRKAQGQLADIEKREGPGAAQDAREKAAAKVIKASLSRPAGRFGL